MREGLTKKKEGKPGRNLLWGHCHGPIALLGTQETPLQRDSRHNRDRLFSVGSSRVKESLLSWMVQWSSPICHGNGCQRALLHGIRGRSIRTGISLPGALANLEVAPIASWHDLRLQPRNDPVAPHVHWKAGTDGKACGASRIFSPISLLHSSMSRRRRKLLPSPSSECYKHALLGLTSPNSVCEAT